MKTQEEREEHLKELNIKMLQDIADSSFVYFVHSYYFECADESDIICKTMYGNTFHSAVNRENVYGVQFHPEFTSNPRNGHPLFIAYVQAALIRQKAHAQ